MDYNSTGSRTRSAGFQTCCIAVLPACGRVDSSTRPGVTTPCRLEIRFEIGDTAGLETYATRIRRSLRGVV